MFKKDKNDTLKVPVFIVSLVMVTKSILEGVGRRGRIVHRRMSLHTSAGLS